MKLSEQLTILDSPFELSRLLKSATKSIFIVGQNLYGLVNGKIEVADSGVDRSSSFRILLENWLMEEKGHRQVQMLMCDPRSSEAVINYAMVFGRVFIPDLCEAITKYRWWQKDMKSIGFDAKVTRTVPLSLIATDGDAGDENNAKMIITPLAFEPTPPIRPRFLITRKYNQAIFDHYYEKFHNLLSSPYTRPISEVSKQELKKCRSLADHLRQSNCPKAEKNALRALHVK